MTAPWSGRARIAALLAVLLSVTGLWTVDRLFSRAKESAAASDWIEIGVATDGTRALVDRTSIIEAGSRVALWQRFAFGRSKARSGGPAAVDQLVVYDCPARTVWTLESRDVDETGKVGPLRPAGQPREDPVPPGSLPELIYDAVC